MNPSAQRHVAMRSLPRRAAMTAEERWIARLAQAAFVLVLTIVASSAYIRLSAGVPDTPSAAIEAARIVHRISASAAGLLVLFIAGLVFTRDRSRWPDIALAAATLAVTLVLAWIGRYSGPDASATVLVSNLTGGLALSTLLWAIAARQSGANHQAPPAAAATLASVTLLAVALQCATGAMTVTEFAKLGLTHHLSGIVALGLCVWLGARLAHSRATQRAGNMIIALGVFQAVLGIAALALSLPLWLVLAHNVGAAMLLAALVQASVRHAHFQRSFAPHASR